MEAGALDFCECLGSGSDWLAESASGRLAGEVRCLIVMRDWQPSESDGLADANASCRMCLLHEVSSSFSR